MEYNEETISKYPTFVAIGQGVYDIAKFAIHHPGGDTLLLLGGSDATVAYHTIHPNFSRTLGKVHPALLPYRVGNYVRGQGICGSNYEFNSEFADDVIFSVKRTLRDKEVTLKYATAFQHVRTILYFLMYVYTMMRWIASPSWLAAILHANSLAFISMNIAHDGSHGVFSGTRMGNLISKMMSYAMDITGAPSVMWIQQHVLRHHTYTNDYDCDKDISSADPYLIFHESDKTEALWFHKWQHLLWPFWLHFYAISVIFEWSAISKFKKYTDDLIDYLSIPYINKRKWMFWIIHVMSHVGTVVIPWYNSNSKLLFPFQLYTVYAIQSLILTTLFLLNHSFENTLRYDSKIKDGDPVDWYKYQVEASSTYGGYISSLLTGGLNYQIEHHLFPRMPSAYYPYITDTVRKACRRHGVKYTFFPSIMHNLDSSIKYLKKVGNRKGI